MVDNLLRRIREEGKVRSERIDGQRK